MASQEQAVPFTPQTCLPPPSPALFYLRDTRLLGPNTPVSPGSVPMMISSSPLGAVNRPKDGPLVTVTVPVQSGLIV